MRTADVLTLRRLPQATQQRRPRLDDHIVARLRAPWIDHELAEGTASWSTVAHAARAVQLTGERSRRSLARSLELLVERSERPEPPRMSPAVPPCREQVRHALPQITRISSRLRSAEPIDARGAARLRELLVDGGGPCYVRRHPAALAEALQEVTRWLAVAS